MHTIRFWIFRGLILFLVSVGIASAQDHQTHLDFSAIEFIGEVDFPSGYLFQGEELGGLSGIVYDRQNNVYYAISDDYSNVAPARFYTLKIRFRNGRLQPGGVRFVRLTTLLDKQGQPFARKSIDPESIELYRDGSLFISSEGGDNLRYPPFVRRFSQAGRYVSELQLPAKFLPDSSGQTGVRRNLAIESLALTPDSRYLFCANENALTQDGPRTSFTDKSPVRIIKYDLQTASPVAEFLYWVEAVPGESVRPKGSASNGLVELIALDSDRLLALERAYVSGVGNTIHFYEVSLAGADNIAALQSIRQTDGTAIKAAHKTLLLTLSEQERNVDNIEGMCLGTSLPDGRTALILVSDNNFNRKTQLTQFLAFAVGQPQNPAAVSIQQIQGTDHLSPLNGQMVQNVSGVVTARIDTERKKGFWMQNSPDGDDWTSDGLFVSTGDRHLAVEAGDRVEVTGTVREAGFARRLTVTQIVADSVRVVSHSDSLPPAIVLGEPAYLPPTTVIDDDSLHHFDPDSDGIDFYERFEGMRVQINDPVVVGPTSRFGEMVVLADSGKDASVRSERGGIIVRETDFNPERILLATTLAKETPLVNIGDSFSGSIVGVLDYSFGNFKVLVTGSFPELHDGQLQKESTELVARENGLTVASYNVENLDFLDSRSKFHLVAQSIVENLRSPDIVGVQEIQDNDGPQDSGVVDASKTFVRLIEEIQDAGGPRYDFCQLNPQNNADGGQPGGNIRVGFLFNPQRVSFRPRNTASDSAEVLAEKAGVGLSSNPGRVAFRHPAFEHSRKPLAAEFVFNGEKVFIINNHLNSKGGDDRLFGGVQPPVLKSEKKRIRQAQVVHDFAEKIMRADPDADIIVLGDMNEHEFRRPMAILAGNTLHDLLRDIEPAERYTYVFNGNSQVLDHIFVSKQLLDTAGPEVDIVHINAEFVASLRASDHDAVLVRLHIPGKE